jgi:uncharacterized protein YgbK (DUF1537 family)
VLQYKVCSTFDSAPEVGNIGLALRCGQEITGCRSVPVIIGMPQLGRYVVFGNLFAAAGADATVYRLDRHPTMATHPRTPMGEADIGRHLHTLAGLECRNVDLEEVRAGRYESSDVDAIVYDTLTTDDLSAVGRAVTAGDGTRFVIGSSGASWAVLAGAGRRDGAPTPELPPGDQQTLVLSASCSPTTEQQLDVAATAGFARFTVDVTSLSSWHAAEEAAIDAARAGASIIVCTERRVDRPPVAPISEQLARVGRATLAESGLRRLVICGGDTSGEVATLLGVTRIDFRWPLDPGAPFTTVVSDDHVVDGLSVVFKGGQMGRPDILVAAQAGDRGRCARSTQTTMPTEGTTR